MEVRQHSPAVPVDPGLITWFRFIAILLITNCHFGVLYPASVSALATGGVIGNTLFFFCSGYALWFTDRSRPAQWFSRRLLRVLLPLWVYLALVVLVVGRPVSLLYFIWPTQWFVKAILCFYVIYFLAARGGGKYLVPVLALVGAAYLVVYSMQDIARFIIEDVYNPANIVWFYYFAAMLYGALLARRGAPRSGRNLYNACGLALTVVAYYAFKGALMGGWVPMALQFLLPLVVFPIGGFAYALLYAPGLRFNTAGRAGRFVFWVSTITYEIYLVQFEVISRVADLPFPAGFLLAVAVIPLVAWAVHGLALLLRRPCDRWLGRLFGPVV